MSNINRRRYGTFGLSPEIECLIALADAKILLCPDCEHPWVGHKELSAEYINENTEYAICDSCANDGATIGLTNMTQLLTKEED